MTFKPASPNQSFPKMEEQLMKQWKEKKIFERQVSEKDPSKTFKFFDGPPFATGLPHYGHIIGSTIKDTVARYFAMQGYHIPRKWGWDCHGLPIENIVEEKLEIASKEEIENYGIAKFCEKCRENVLIYTEEWKRFIDRMGRFVDMEDDYKTMDFPFMESVWWVFKSLHDEGLIYESKKSIHYCPHCDTPLSNFEVTQGYKDITDQSAYALFELANEPNTHIIAWTTTPWTLPGNVALAVGSDIDYVKVKDEAGTTYILAKDIFEAKGESLFGEELPHIVSELKGKDLENQKYKPVFNYFDHPTKYPDCAETITPDADIAEAWKNYCTIVAADFVSTTDGTGIVHIAPAFGEDDFNLGKTKNLPLLRHVKPNGTFVNEISDWAGQEVKPREDNAKMDRKINEYLESVGKLFKKENYRHSYPHCWRCDSPLINYTAPSFFLHVEKIKQSMLDANQQINWTPEHIKDGRFGKWLEGARDWAISRNRFWGTPLPIWKCDCCGDTVCVESAEELEKYSGTKVDDLHKHIVDEVTWECKKCGSGQSVKLTFVRHGHTEWNGDKRLQSFSDIPLNQDGIDHAQSLAKEIRESDYDVVISSPLCRAKQTAEILCPNKEIITDELIREVSAGDFEGLTKDEVFAKFDDMNEKRDLRWARQHNVETPEEVALRLTEFVKKIEKKYPDKKVLVVTHGFVLHCLEWMEHNKDEATFEKSFPNLYEMKRTIVPTFYRTPEVLDCWFESGSMPYAQTADKADAIIPADFIAEGLDQTRGWFYTLTVLAAGLTQTGKLKNVPEIKPAFKNCIVNGIVLAEDGKKMSKRLKNYPDPSIIFDKYGADAMRFYLLNSPAVKAEDLRFSERGVEETVRSVLLPLWNAYSFFTTYAAIDGFTPSKNPTQSDNALDKWIVARIEQLNLDLDNHMQSYHLYEATELFTPFLDDLTNWYIRRSRRRFWKSDSDTDKQNAYQTLYTVLKKISIMLAPFCPFITDEIYTNLTDADSVHLADFPTADESLVDEKILQEVNAQRQLVSLGLALRAKEELKVRQPLASATVALPDGISLEDKERVQVVADELNVKEIIFTDKPEDIAQIQVNVNARALGPRIGGKVQEVIKAVKSGQYEIKDDGVHAGGEVLTGEEISVGYVGKEGLPVASDRGFVITFDTALTDDLKLEGMRKDLNRAIQDLRKEAGLEVSDRITLSVVGLNEVISAYSEWLKAETLATEISTEALELHLALKEIKIDNKDVIIALNKN